MGIQFLLKIKKRNKLAPRPLIIFNFACAETDVKQMPNCFQVPLKMAHWADGASADLHLHSRGMQLLKHSSFTLSGWVRKHSTAAQMTMERVIKERDWAKVRKSLRVWVDNDWRPPHHPHITHMLRSAHVSKLQSYQRGSMRRFTSSTLISLNLIIYLASCPCSK